MAQLLKTPYPLPEMTFDGNWRESAHEQAMRKLMAEKDVVGFPAADGYAYYLVVSLEPLKLQYIPYADEYQVSPIFIRGLRKADVQRMLKKI